MLGGNVAGTVGEGITTLELTDTMIFAVLTGMAIVLILSSGFGLPISTTHAMVGSITGLAIYEAGSLALVNLDKLGSIVASWFLSPAIGMAGSFIIYRGVDKILQKYTTGLDSVARNERIAANLLLVFVVVTAVSRGGNDVANAVSPLMQMFSGEGLTSIPLLIGGLGMATGLILLARKVLRTLGNEIVELTPSKALAVQISTAVITFAGANLGIPLSGTHILVASFIGVALSSKSQVNYRVVGKIAGSAISTPVLGAIISITLFLLFTSLGF